MQEVAASCDLDLDRDLARLPKSLHVEVRVINPVGAFMTSDGRAVDLQVGSTHNLLRQDAEKLLQQGDIRLVD